MLNNKDASGVAEGVARSAATPRIILSRSTAAARTEAGGSGGGPACTGGHPVESEVGPSRCIGSGHPSRHAKAANVLARRAVSGARVAYAPNVGANPPPPRLSHGRRCVGATRMREPLQPGGGEHTPFHPPTRQAYAGSDIRHASHE